MSDRISIFDIPHIAEGIGQQLERSDLKSCMEVCKAWSERFRSLRWRELTIMSGPSRANEELNSDNECILMENFRWTRQLAVHTPTRCEGILPLLSASCTNLQELSSHIYPAKEGWNAAFSDILDLLGNNKKLRRWSFHVWIVISIPERLRIIDYLSGSRLTDLNLRLFFRPHQSWLGDVLQSLPQTLRKLNVQWGRASYDTEGLAEHNQWNWPDEYPHLEKAKFSTYLTNGEEMPLFKFLERCPVLKKLTFPRVPDREMAGRLVRCLETTKITPKRITLDLLLIEEMDQQNWRRLLQTLEGRISRLMTGIAHNRRSMDGFIDVMSRTWFKTLELLHIDEPRRIRSRDLQLILTRCSNLKSFECLNLWIHDSIPTDIGDREMVPGLEAMVRDNSDGSLDIADWSCLDLEHLELTISDGRRVDAEEHVMSSQEEWTVQGIKHIYRQLGRLTKLRELTLGWSTTNDFASCANFDITLASGLDYLKDLKSLKLLDVNLVRMVKTGEEEVKWMADNWPSLNRVAGFKYRKRLTDDSQQLTSYFDLFREVVPGLLLL